MTEKFSTAIAVTPAGEGAFTATVTPAWSQGRAAFGGLLSGQMLRAAEAVLPGLPLRSAVVDFLAPAGPGEVSLAATILRQGRSMSRVSVALHQGGACCATLQAAYGPRRQTAIEHEGPAAPQTAPPEELTPMPWIEGVIPRFTRQFDYRHVGARFPFTGQAEPGVGGLVRLRDDAPVDAAGILALVDAWPSPALPLLTAPAPASTVTWMINLPGGPVSAAPSDWWRFEGELISSTGGFSDIEGRLWGPDGRLVASSRQLVAEFSRP